MFRVTVKLVLIIIALITASLSAQEAIPKEAAGDRVLPHEAGDRENRTDTGMRLPMALHEAKCAHAAAFSAWWFALATISKTVFTRAGRG